MGHYWVRHAKCPWSNFFIAQVGTEALWTETINKSFIKGKSGFGKPGTKHNLSFCNLTHFHYFQFTKSFTFFGNRANKQSSEFSYRIRVGFRPFFVCTSKSLLHCWGEEDVWAPPYLWMSGHCSWQGNIGAYRRSGHNTWEQHKIKLQK